MGLARDDHCISLTDSSIETWQRSQRPHCLEGGAGTEVMCLTPGHMARQWPCQDCLSVLVLLLPLLHIKATPKRKGSAPSLARVFPEVSSRSLPHGTEPCTPKGLCKNLWDGH